MLTFLVEVDRPGGAAPLACEADPAERVRDLIRRLLEKLAISGGPEGWELLHDSRPLPPDAELGPLFGASGGGPIVLRLRATAPPPAARAVPPPGAPAAPARRKAKAGRSREVEAEDDAES